jgi:hypothetical protein
MPASLAAYVLTAALAGRASREVTLSLLVGERLNHLEREAINPCMSSTRVMVR